MARRPARKSAAKAGRASADRAVPPDASTREKIIAAFMALLAEKRFEEIGLVEIAEAAGVSLAEFRGEFASPLAILAAHIKDTDRVVLAADFSDMTEEPPRERLFDVLMRRLEAMTPYREGVREALAWLRREPVAALAMNQVSTNSMRFMLEAAGIEARGAAGAVKLQGLALAWGRVLQIWLDDDDPALSKTMVELDRMLTRGERAVAGLDRVSALTSPFSALVQAAFEAGRRARRGGSRPARKDDPGDEDVTAL